MLAATFDTMVSLPMKVVNIFFILPIKVENPDPSLYRTKYISAFGAQTLLINYVTIDTLIKLIHFDHIVELYEVVSQIQRRADPAMINYIIFEGIELFQKFSYTLLSA